LVIKHKPSWLSSYTIPAILSKVASNLEENLWTLGTTEGICEPEDVGRLDKVSF
jgi:hypothetical protein